jgi:hypothetical protein
MPCSAASIPRSGRPEARPRPYCSSANAARGTNFRRANLAEEQIIPSLL